MQRLSDTQILVRGVDPTTSGTFRDIVTQQFTDWALAPAAGEANGYLLTMKPSVIADLQANTMDQSLETITRRINAPRSHRADDCIYRPRSTDEILVELPGEGDPTPRQGRDSGGRPTRVAAGCGRSALPVRSRGARGSRRRLAARNARLFPGRSEGPSAQAVAAGVLHPRARTGCHGRRPARRQPDSKRRNIRVNIKWISRFRRPRPRGSVRSRKQTSATKWRSCSTIKVYSAPVN